MAIARLQRRALDSLSPRILEILKSGADFWWYDPELAPVTGMMAIGVAHGVLLAAWERAGAEITAEYARERPGREPWGARLARGDDLADHFAPGVWEEAD